MEDLIAMWRALQGCRCCRCPMSTNVYSSATRSTDLPNSTIAGARGHRGEYMSLSPTLDGGTRLPAPLVERHSKPELKGRVLLKGRIADRRPAVGGRVQRTVQENAAGSSATAMQLDERLHLAWKKSGSSGRPTTSFER